MKCFLTIGLLTVFLYSVAQEELPRDPETNKVTYSEVVEADEILSAVLFKRAEQWMKNYYKANQLTYSDEKLGELKQTTTATLHTKGAYGMKIDNVVSYSILVSVKDNKYKYTITDFLVDYAGMMHYDLETFYKKTKAKNKEEINKLISEETDAAIKSLKEAMKTGKISAQQGEW